MGDNISRSSIFRDKMRIKDDKEPIIDVDELTKAVKKAVKEKDSLEFDPKDIEEMVKLAKSISGKEPGE